MKLISMTDFVLVQERTNGGFGIEEADRIWSYTKFLKQKLELWIFVPCKLVDSVWVVLEEPKEERKKASLAFYQQELKEYEEAKDRVLFEGFVIDGQNAFTATVGNGRINYDLKQVEAYALTIENLVNDNLELTPTAQKQIGL